MIKTNLISITALHVYDSFYMQFPSINNEELSHRWKSFEICKFRLISFLGVLENTLACSFVTHGFSNCEIYILEQIFSMVECFR